MLNPPHRGSLWRAVIAAACLFVVFALAFAPHAHASECHHWHHAQHHHHHHDHRVRIAIDVRTGAIERDPFAFMGSLFQPPMAAAQSGIEHGIAVAGAAPPRVVSGTSAVLREASRFVGAHNPTRFRGPWCAAFLNMVLSRTGHRHALSMRAIDALHDGYRVRDPQPGDIAILSFSRHHHVTFFARWGGRGFYGLGGNQNHRVMLSSYPINRVIAWVRPS